MTQAVVVALDLSESSLAALRYAFRLFAQSDNEIHVLRCIEEAPAEGEESAEHLERTNSVRREVEAIVRETDPPPAMISVHVVFSTTPANAITQLADKVNADLVLVGAGGKGGVECSFALGSCTEAVLRNAGRAVLVARASQVNTGPTVSS